MHKEKYFKVPSFQLLHVTLIHRASFETECHRSVDYYVFSMLQSETK